MTLSAWRITKQKNTQSAFSGEGARLFGGRWNHPGTSLIYAAESQALAVLEVLVHLDSPELLKKYILFEISIDPVCVHDLDLSGLPRNWKENPSPARVRSIGSDWIGGGRSAVLRVPSALVPSEFTYLLNPHHVDFRRLRIAKPLRYQFDPRLIKRNRGSV